VPRSEEAKQRIREEQRTHILEAARRIFARKGIDATMDDIATEAAVSHGLAYRYFISKDEILSTLAEQAFRATPMTFTHVLGTSMTPGERLNKIVSELVESRRYPEFYQLFDHMRNSEATPEDLRELVHQRSHALRGVIRQLIVEGQATGEVVAGDPDQLVRALLACLDGLIKWAEYDPEHYNEHFPEAEIFLRLLKP
jgi:AcrR family transcriptional regulator